jgi:hypothetical protein
VSSIRTAFGRRSFSSRSSSTPSIPGMRWSLTTTWNGWVRAISSACSPLEAVTTS